VRQIWRLGAQFLSFFFIRLPVGVLKYGVRIDLPITDNKYETWPRSSRLIGALSEVEPPIVLFVSVTVSLSVSTQTDCPCSVLQKLFHGNLEVPSSFIFLRDLFTETCACYETIEYHIQDFISDVLALKNNK
jgi:hypothetical protein